MKGVKFTVAFLNGMLPAIHQNIDFKYLQEEQKQLWCVGNDGRNPQYSYEA